MKLFPVPPLLWSTLLVLWVSQSETNQSDVCQDPIDEDMLIVQDATKEELKYMPEEKDTFICLLRLTNELNCSWSFHTLEKDSQLSAHISVCDGDMTAQSLNRTSVGRVGSESLFVNKPEEISVVLRLNMSLHDKWTSYTCKFGKDVMDFLSPPRNISAAVKNGDLKVSWEPPQSRLSYEPSCFMYQLDMGDQKENTTGLQSYVVPNADPTHTYRLRMRTMVSHHCYGCPQWSDWSHPVTVFPAVKPSVYPLNPLVIISLSLGIPMVLLAVLLFVRYQRVSEVLFPPIPRPPPKYKYFLEKSDAFNFFHPAQPAKPEEEITEVEDAEQNPRYTV